MVFPLYPHDISIVLQWYIYNIPNTFRLYSNGIPIIFTLYSNCTLIMFPWFIIGFTDIKYIHSRHFSRSLRSRDQLTEVMNS